MRSYYFIIPLALVIGFGAGVAFSRWGQQSPKRYQIASAGQAGNAFRLDTQTGDAWLLTASGEETFVTPPTPPLTKESITELYTTLKEGNVPGLPQSLRAWAIKMNQMTGTNGRSSGAYDAVLVHPSK